MKIYLYFSFFLWAIFLKAQSPLALDSLEEKLGNEDPSSQVYVKILMAMSDELRQVNPDSSLHTATRAFNVINQHGYNELRASALHRIATAHNFLGNYDTSVVISFEAIEEGKKLSDKGPLMKALNGQAINFYYLNDLDKAAEYFGKCYDVALEEGDELEAANALQNIGLVKGILGDVTSEIENYQEARKAMVNLGFEEGVANIDMNIGTAYVSLRKFQEGLEAFEKAKVVFEKLGHQAALCVIHTNLAETNLMIGNFKKAEQNALLSISIAEELSLSNEKKYTLEILSRVYESLGDYRKAFSTLKEYQLLKDSIFQNEKLKQIEELKVAYETQQKEDDIALLNTSNELKDARIKQQRFFLILLIGGTVLFLVLVFTLHNRYKLKKKSDEEKALLLKEIHHRVKNNLQIIESLLSLQDRTKGDRKPEDLLKISQDRIHAISTIHEKLYQSETLKEINFNTYLKDLISHFSTSYAANEVTFKTKIEEVNLDLDQLIPCGLIVNELVTNSLKYAFDKTDNPVIEVSGETSDDIYILKISDNGCGFENSETNTSIGLKLVHSLVNQMNGMISKLKSEGTSYQISFKPQ
ncbi:histidine kinase dimerization/phosphoacceptor domain -containing protein [Ekhidna sp.]|uniref:tetratricopeptide repeat-containing sensor histidine kinase n=1 Tax=Ekhidna sp. TaxID=2608089 RepID=UPI003516783B